MKPEEIEFPDAVEMLPIWSETVKENLYGKGQIPGKLWKGNCLPFITAATQMGKRRPGKNGNRIWWKLGKRD